MKPKYTIIFILFLDNICSSNRIPLPQGFQPGSSVKEQELEAFKQHILAELEMMKMTIRQYMDRTEKAITKTHLAVKGMNYYQELASSTNKKLNEHEEFINDFRRVLNQQAEFIINLQRRFDSHEERNKDLYGAIDTIKTLYEVLRSDIGAIKVDSSAIKKEIDKLFQNRFIIEERIKNIEQYLPLLIHLKETLFLKLNSIDTQILDLQSRIAAIEKSRTSNALSLQRGAISLRELLEQSRAQIITANISRSTPFE